MISNKIDAFLIQVKCFLYSITRRVRMFTIEALFIAGIKVTRLIIFK